MKRLFLGVYGLVNGAFVGAFLSFGVTVIAYFVVSAINYYGGLTDAYAAKGHDLVWLIVPIGAVWCGLEGCVNGFKTGIWYKSA